MGGPAWKGIHKQTVLRHRVPKTLGQRRIRIISMLRNCATDNEISFEELLRQSDRWLLRQPNMGAACLRVFQELKSEYGLSDFSEKRV
jgi:hypothetical protein